MFGVIPGSIVMLVFGWALIYWDALPQAFAYTSVSNGRPAGFIEALYFSMVTLSTLGHGDLVPITTSIRFIAALQGLVGFSMITACIT